MKQLMFAIHDKAAGTYLAPSYEQTRETAVRNFKVAMNRKDLYLYVQPSDFSFYYLGMFDNKSGEFELLKTPEFICDGNSVLEK